MIYNLETINAKEYNGSMLFLYGDDVPERTFPLSQKELRLLKERRAEKKEQLIAFDRLPDKLYFLSFDSSQPMPECQETLRRKAANLLKMLETDRVHTLAVTGAGILPEEVMAVVEGITLAD